MSNHKQVGGAGETDGWYRLGAGISGRSRGMCSLAHVSDGLGVKHLVAQVGLTLTSPSLG